VTTIEIGLEANKATVRLTRDTGKFGHRLSLAAQMGEECLFVGLPVALGFVAIADWFRATQSPQMRVCDAHLMEGLGQRTLLRSFWSILAWKKWMIVLGLEKRH
jgi:hypothetical protein